MILEGFPAGMLGGRGQAVADTVLIPQGARLKASCSPVTRWWPSTPARWTACLWSGQPASSGVQGPGGARGTPGVRPGLTACPLCRDAGDELVLTVLRCASVSGPARLGTHGLAAGSEGLANGLRVP